MGLFSKLAEQQKDQKVNVELAGKEIQEKTQTEMGGVYKVDPDSAFTLVETKDGIQWQNKDKQSIFDDVKCKVMTKNGEKEVEVGSRIEALQFVLIRPRVGLGQYDSNEKKMVCNSIACFPENPKMNRFSDRPLEIPTYGPKGYDSNEASDLIKKNGVFGKKGMFCETCVAKGENEYKYNDENGKEVSVRCSGGCDLLVAVTAFGIKVKDRVENDKGGVDTILTVVWKDFSELYSEDTQEAIFDSPPIVRLKLTNKTAYSKKQFPVITKANTDSSDAGSKYVPEDVKNVAIYLQELRKEILDDNLSYVVVAKNPNDDSFFNLYRGLHELWLCKPAPDADVASSVNTIAQLRLADECKEALDLYGPSSLTNITMDVLQDYWKEQQEFFANNTSNLPYTPFTPPELKQYENTKSLSDNSSKEEKSLSSSNDVISTSYSLE